MDDDKQDAPAMGGEQAADFARLAAAAAEPNAEVARIEGQQAEAEQSAENELVASNTTALAMIFDLAAPTFEQFGFPSVAGVLVAKDDNTGMTAAQTLSCAWAPVLAKYGVDLSNMSDKYRVEIVAVMVTIPIGKALFAAVKSDTVGARARQVAAPASAPAAQPAESPKAEVLG